MRYDFNGNLTNLVDTLLRTNRWTYDANGRNTETLDADGLRLARGVGLAGDIGTLVAVTYHAGSSTNGVFYTQHNHRGDITLTRAGTATVGRYGYSAFGILHSALGPDVCRFKFSSKEREAATGFSYYGYRFYSPNWQRWLNRDPIEEEGGLNLYLLADNCPTVFFDPVGMSAISQFKDLRRALLARLVKVLNMAMGICPKKACDSKTKCKACCFGIWGTGEIVNWLGTGFGALGCAASTHPGFIIGCTGLLMWTHIEVQVALAQALRSCLDECDKVSK